MTLLAFILFPISLAGTIFGMNVQQINQTGSDIKVFLITAAALVLSSLLLWAVSSGFAAYRRELVNRFVESGKSSFEERTWQERLLFVDLSKARVTESWFYWSIIWPFMHPTKYIRRRTKNST